MDHYPGLNPFRVKDEPLRPAEWLLFDHGDYEPCALEDYPIVRGWSSDQIEALRSQEHAHPFSAESLALIQSWMFLGSLEALTRRHISVAKFLRRKFKRPAVHTGFLTSYLLEWLESVKEETEAEQAQLSVRLNNVLTEIQSWCYRLATSAPATITMDINSNTTAGELVFTTAAVDSVTRLLTLVGETIRCAAGYLPRIMFASMGGFLGCYTPDEASRLVIRLVKKGWCPHVARMLFTYRYSIAEYAAFYSRYRLLSISKVSHKDAGCTEAQCVAHDVDIENYVTRHATAGCCCPFMVPPLDQILELLRNGRIPVVSLTAENTTVPKLGVKCSTVTSGDAKGYVAFSHVWSDGLGSNTESGLPQCVVNKLFTQSRAYGRDSIWIDSLCVPSDAYRLDRERAIKLMAKTYQNAAITIVLDSSIRAASFDLSPAGVAQTLLSLATSPWSQRLWTLQEARLSRSLIFQFHNTMATSLDIWLGLVKVSHEHWHVNPVTQRLGNELLRLIRPSQDTEAWPSKELELGDLCSMLQRRRTSKPIDETVAIAGLVKVDVGFLQEEVTPEDRMKRFFISLRKIPSDIVMSPLPRLRLAGFRWAPSTFMAHGDTTMHWGLSTRDSVRWAHCLPQGGLQGRYTLTKFAESVSVTENQPSIVAEVEQKAFKVKYFPKYGNKAISLGADEICFDTVATLPHLEQTTILGLQLGAALSALGGGDASADVAVYEYRGRVLIGDMSRYAWATGDIATRINCRVEEDVEIVIT